MAHEAASPDAGTNGICHCTEQVSLNTSAPVMLKAGWLTWVAVVFTNEYMLKFISQFVHLAISQATPVLR
jgi:hypothetical protein